MAFFTKHYLEFFKELDKNNHKEWFHENKKTYDKEVKKPFAEFTLEMIKRIQQEDPEIQLEPKDVIFRINRDIRFSADKSPYKTHLAANITKGGRKAMGYPGFYFQLSPLETFVAAGTYMPDKDELQRIREALAADPKKFLQIVNNDGFREKWGSILGEQNKRLPKEFDEALKTQPLIANKQFYTMKKLDPSVIVRDDLPEILMEHYTAARPLNLFLVGAMKK